MYVGIGTETDRRISDEDAFSYALERCLLNKEDWKEFGDAFNFYIFGGLWYLQSEKFREELVDWFYSGNWVKEESKSE